MFHIMYTQRNFGLNIVFSAKHRCGFVIVCPPVCPKNLFGNPLKESIFGHITSHADITTWWKGQYTKTLTRNISVFMRYHPF